MKQNDEEMEEKSLEKKKEYARLAMRAERNWKKQKQAVDRLKSTLQHVKNRVDEVIREFTLLSARQDTAETSKNVSKTLSTIPEGSVGRLLEALDEKVSVVEAEAKALEEVFGR